MQVDTGGELHEVKDHTRPRLDSQSRLTDELLGSHLSLYQVHSATLESGVLQVGHSAGGAGIKCRGAHVCTVGPLTLPSLHLTPWHALVFTSARFLGQSAQQRCRASSIFLHLVGPIIMFS